MQDQQQPKELNCVLFTDGSCRGNPGFAGFGVFGYTYEISDKPKNYKHPYHSSLYFTTTGIKREKDKTPIEVNSIIEIIEAIKNPQSTNNDAELQAFITALKKAQTIPNLKDLTIYTDSNYIVTGFNDNLTVWLINNWRRLDGKQIVHIKEWSTINEIYNQFKKDGVTLKVNWVKAHSDHYGNNIADIYSVIGSNAAKLISSTDYNSILYSEISYSDYKNSYTDKDFIFHFKELYFSSDALDDANYCFISSSEDPTLFGRRSTASIFVLNIGYVPPIINSIKRFYRTLPRNYVTTCCLKINKLENKDFFRLTDKVDISYLLVKSVTHNKAYSLVNDNTSFLYENVVNFPFIVNASSLFSKMSYIDSLTDEQRVNIYKYNLTNFFIDKSTRKLKLTNKDKTFDFSEFVAEHINLKQKLVIKVGYDIPNYLALKNIEKDINEVTLILEVNNDTNFCTAYMHIDTTTRSIYSVNIENKYLKN